MILVLVVTWLRFFVYFLVMRNISKLLLTLSAMVGDTLSFMFLVVCFILIMASVFTTLYQDVAADKFGNLTLTIRSLFDASLANYDFEMTPERETSYSALMVFNVFFANILLMNYLIAILSTTYEMMRQSGIFRYKVNLYTYCERFMLAFKNRVYGELILHPPPLTYMSIGFIMPVFCSSNGMEKMSKLFSYFMYWLENVVFSTFFLIFELFIAIPSYFKIFHNIFVNCRGARLAGFLALWLFIGPAVSIFMAFEDCKNLFKIYFDMNGSSHLYFES